MNDVYTRVREMRPIVAPNLIFMSQLMDFETCLLVETTHDKQSQEPPHPQIADLLLSNKFETAEKADNKTATD